MHAIIYSKKVNSMQKNKILIDFDGVIFDTEKRVVDMKKSHPNMTWNEFFDKLDWFKLLQESNIINNSINYILDTQDSNNQIAILTKIHTLVEMQAKVKALRSRGIEVPILFVPPHVKKSQVYLPNNEEILIDDSLKNLVDWKQNGGTSIYFNEELVCIPQFKTIKSLNKVL